MTPAQLITSQFPHVALIPMTKAGRAIGLAEQTCYNLRLRGQFPLPVRKVGSKVMVAVCDLITYVEGGQPAAAPIIEQPKRRRGRPTNAERRLRGACW